MTFERREVRTVLSKKMRLAGSFSVREENP